MQTALIRDAGVEVPLICGAMYPCSNPSLIAAVSEAGALGVIQPVALAHVYGLTLSDGLRAIRAQTRKPVALNVPLDARSRAHREQGRRWVDLALDRGVRFFLASSGNVEQLVRATAPAGGKVYQDVVTAEQARRAADAGVHGVVCLNRNAGGRPGWSSAEALWQACAGLQVPVVCAGGVGDAMAFVRALRLGYSGVVMGTRFIATPECTASDAHKAAILRAAEGDIVHTHRVSGSPLSVIETPFVRRVGTTVGFVERLLYRSGSGRRWLRSFDAWRSRDLARAGRATHGEYFSAGTSVGGIQDIEPAGAIVRRFGAALRDATVGRSCTSVPVQ